MSEFAFELALCSHLETERDAIVARQLGGGVADPGGRVLDTVLVEPGPEFEQRSSITEATIPDAAIEADVGAGRYRRLTEAIEGPPERARRIAEHAAEIGFFERERIDGQAAVRQVTRYPDGWFEELLAIENKPDLGRPGALDTQLRIDTSLGLADRVILATESHVTGAHRNRIPDPVGIWRVHRESTGTGDIERIEVIDAPEQLPVDRPGVELLDRQPGHSEIEIVSADRIARARRRIAERAYGKGWRTHEFPDCARMRPPADGRPYCNWAESVVDPASQCGADCPGYEPGDTPAIDAAERRDERSPWVADPDGRARRQTGLDRFG